MAKFSVEYARTVRVKAYETVKVGLVMEFEKEAHDPDLRFGEVRAYVEEWITDSLHRLKAEGVKPA